MTARSGSAWGSSCLQRNGGKTRVQDHGSSAPGLEAHRMDNEVRLVGDSFTSSAAKSSSAASDPVTDSSLTEMEDKVEHTN